MPIARVLGITISGARQLCPERVPGLGRFWGDRPSGADAGFTATGLLRFPDGIPETDRIDRLRGLTKSTIQNQIIEKLKQKDRSN